MASAGEMGTPASSSSTSPKVSSPNVVASGVPRTWVRGSVGVVMVCSSFPCMFNNHPGRGRVPGAGPRCDTRRLAELSALSYIPDLFSQECRKVVVSRSLRPLPLLAVVVLLLGVAASCSSDASTRTAGADGGPTTTAVPVAELPEVPAGVTLEVGDQLEYLQTVLALAGEDDDFPYA